ncbi:unnamed protein product [Lota lota]
MLSRKISASGSGLMASAGIDRGRVGERLQAALAGLHELHLLREKQGDMVNWALRMDREEPTTTAAQTSSAARGSMLANEEQRLEATLTALKQQLSRLRRQDVGLKTHLQQLDQQISELKLDVNKVSPDQPESDSRPSSGFYELSDGGSCSLSNSCTSVYSECLSSSQTSLLQAPGSPPPVSHHVSPAVHAEASRRRWADEAAAPRPAGLRPGLSRIRTGAAGLEGPRPRPVSTGDLDRMTAAGPGSYKLVPGKTHAVGPVPGTSTLDSKFQGSLMSRNGTEVYHYPSPLHAVALQSPVFSLAGEPCRGPPAAAGPGGPQKGHRVGPEAGRLGYIDMLLRRNTTGTSVRSEERGDARRTPREPRDAAPPRPVPAGALDIHSLEAKWERECRPERVTLPPCRPQSECHAPESLQRCCCPAAVGERRGAAAPAEGPTRPPAERSTLTRRHSEKRPTGVRETRAAQKKCPAAKPVLALSSGTEDRLGRGRGPPRAAAPDDFVHAEFVPAGSRRVKVRQADRKTKAVKLRRKTGEKPRAARPQLGYSSGERAGESQGSGCRGEPEPRRSAKGTASPRLGEQHRHSGSDSSLCGPGFMHTHRVHPTPISCPAFTKSGKGRRPQRPEPEPPVDQRRRRRPGTGRGPGDAEVLQAPCAPSTRGLTYPHGAAPPRQTAHAAPAAPHSGQWAGPSRSCKPAVSSSCFFSALNARYPPAPCPAGGGRRPPRCESEYSAECASLFHSTIAESSAGALSDDTADHFGDSESSQSSRGHSASDSSLSLEEDEDRVARRHHEEGGVLLWAQAAKGRAGAGAGAGVALQRPPHPVPLTCRIKASRALKKKIRRFQPASLKVMTLV